MPGRRANPPTTERRLPARRLSNCRIAPCWKPALPPGQAGLPYSGYSLCREGAGRPYCGRLNTTPDRRTNLILYDDGCPLCTFQMRVVTWLDWFNTVSLLPLSNPRAAEVAPHLTR